MNRTGWRPSCRWRGPAANADRVGAHRQGRPGREPGGAAGVGPLGCQLLESGDQIADFAVAAEIQGRILLIETEQAGIGGALGVQGEAPLIVQGQFTELAGEGLQAGLAGLAQVELLQVGRDRRQGFAAGRGPIAVGAKQLNNGFTEGAGLNEFGKAPLGGHPIGALDDQQGLGGFNLAV